MASPCMAPDVRDKERESRVETIRVRRDTLIWLGTVLLQLLVWVYSQGKLTERVDALHEQINRLEQRLDQNLGSKK